MKRLPSQSSSSGFLSHNRMLHLSILAVIAFLVSGRDGEPTVVLPCKATRGQCFLGVTFSPGTRTNRHRICWFLGKKFMAAIAPSAMEKTVRETDGGRICCTPSRATSHAGFSALRPPKAAIYPRIGIYSAPSRWVCKAPPCLAGGLSCRSKSAGRW